MSEFITEYLGKTTELLNLIAHAEEDALDRAAEIIADAYANGNTIYVFGCTHSAILAEDVFYRANTPVSGVRSGDLE